MTNGHIGDVGAEPVTVAETFGGNLLVLAEDRLVLTDVDVNIFGVGARRGRLHNAGNDGPLLALEGAKDAVCLGIAQTLRNDRTRG